MAGAFDDTEAELESYQGYSVSESDHVMSCLLGLGLPLLARKALDDGHVSVNITAAKVPWEWERETLGASMGTWLNFSFLSSLPAILGSAHTAGARAR